MRRGLIAVCLLGLSGVAVAADEVPINVERLKADSLAQHKELLKWERDNLKWLVETIAKIKKAKVDSSLPARPEEDTSANDGTASVQASRSHWLSISGVPVVSTQEAKQSVLEKAYRQRDMSKDRIAQGVAKSRKFIPFLRPPYVRGQVGRFENAAYGESASPTTATVRFKATHEDSGTVARLHGLDFDWPKDREYLYLDDDSDVYQYTKTADGVPQFTRLSDKQSYEAFRILNGNGLLP